MADCVFCKIVAGHIPATKVYEDDDLIAFEDMNPAAPHHLLIVPKEHIATLNDAVEADAALLGKLMLRAQAIVKERGLSEDGYRVVMNCNAGAGQTVFHIHLHMLGGREMTWPPG